MEQGNGQEKKPHASGAHANRKPQQHVRFFTDRSVGVVLFREEAGQRLYLALTKKRSTDFAKGHVESGETDEQAAIRETREETGITDVELIPGYHGETRYILRKKGEVTRKTVAFFLGRTSQSAVVISNEHQGFKWLPYEEALRFLTFENQRNLVRKAEEVMRGGTAQSS